LVPLHRRTRLRSVEPAYTTTATHTNATEPYPTNNVTTFDDDLIDSEVAYGVWDTFGDQLDTWDQQGTFPVATPAHTSNRTFFKDASPDRPTFNTCTHDIDTDFESSCVDDNNMYGTDGCEALVYRSPVWESTTSSPVGSNMGNIDCVETTAEKSTCGLQQFQDAHFDHRLAYQYSVHPTTTPYNAGGGTYPFSSGVNSVYSTCDRDVQGCVLHTTAPATNLSSISPIHNSTLFPIHTSTSSLPTTSDLLPYSHYNYTDYTNRYTTITTANCYDNSYNHSPVMPHYTNYPTNNVYSAQFLQDVGVLDDCWKHQQFPGLLRS